MENGTLSVHRKRGRWLIAAVAVLLMAIAGAWWFLAPHDGDAARKFIIADIHRGDIEQAVTALGNLQPRDYVDVGAQVSGQLKQLHVNIGDNVRTGDLLAEIDPVVLKAKVGSDHAQLLNLQAQLRERQAQLDLARRQFERQKVMMKQDATSEDAYDTSKAAAETTAAQIDSLKAQIQQTQSTLQGDEATLGYTRIYAPMDGTVVSLSARQGQTLNANQVAPIILRIADLKTMTVWTQVSEADVSKLRIGMPAYFTTLGQPDKRWHGALKQILPTPEIINNVVLYTALFDVDNPDRELMTQMTAQVFFVVAEARDVLVVPMTALRAIEGSEDRFTARVLTGRGRPEERDVTIGARDRLNAQVRSGLQPGERVIVGVRRDESAGGEKAGGPTRIRFRGI